MSQKQIVVEIDQIGRAKVDAQGFQGQGCLKATKELIDKLSGGEGGDTKLKPEANMLDTSVAQHQQLRNP